MQANDDWQITGGTSSGKKMRGGGTASIAAGASTVVVTHNIAAAPDRIYLTPTSSTQGRYFWTSTKTSTQFTINLDANAVTNPITFDWLAEITS
jgi:hypothetical protein